MSKSLILDHNISHNEKWNIVKNKFEILLKTKDGINALKEISFLMSNDSNFNENHFFDLFNEFSKKINFLKYSR